MHVEVSGTGPESGKRNCGPEEDEPGMAVNGKRDLNYFVVLNKQLFFGTANSGQDV